jgi:hypothetical protein
MSAHRLQYAPVAAVLLVACTPTRPPASPAGAKPWGVIYSRTNTRASPSYVGPRVSRKKALAALPRDAQGKPTYPVLVLSGGGAYGAYGAGLLCGWTARGTRPTFRIVTGVSTGALTATQAFLGPAHDAAIRKAYTSISSEDIFSMRSLPTVPSKGSLADTSPLRKLLEQWDTPGVLDAVAAEHRKGRRLYVSTTNLDEHAFTIWDMGAIAASGRPDRRKRYLDVLQAAASIPVLFPPVYITVEQGGRQLTQMHTDTLHEGAFFREAMLHQDPVYLALHEAHEPPAVKLYVVANYPVKHPQKTPLEPDLRSVGNAVVDIVMGQLIYGSLLRIYLLTRQVPMELNISVLPGHLTLKKGAIDFDQQQMNKIYDFGFQLAKSGDPWKKHPPRLDRAERGALK